MNKTLYIRVEDAPIWEKAQGLADGKLSSLVTNYLKSYVATKEGAAKGYERIVLRLYEDEIPKAYAFQGRWIIPPNKPFIVVNNHDSPDDCYAVAETPKHNFVFLSWMGIYGDSDPDGYFELDRFDVADSLENKPEHIPASVIAEAMKRMGIAVQELDI